jgi:NADPH:quinone reductase-like Zn-dependent oxidoreductase
MPRAVQFDHYGGTDVLKVVDVPRPTPGHGEVLVRVKAAGINPGEAKIREGMLHSRWPATFPSGQGSDLAGVVEELGDAVERIAVGDEVLGFTDNRASHAEYAVTSAEHLTDRPPAVPWDAAGALFVAGSTAYACVRAVSLSDGDTVVVAGAAGGVGSLAVQLARKAGARVIGLAGERNHHWLSGLGVVPVAYGEGVEGRIREASDGKPDAFIDAFGGDYVDVALRLGVRPQRVNTIVNFEAPETHGVNAEGSATAANADVLAELARLVAEGRLEVPIARGYALEEVQEAFRELERNHTRGKIVLRP